MTESALPTPWRHRRAPVVALTVAVAAFGPALHVGTFLGLARAALVAIVAGSAVAIGSLALDRRWWLRAIAIGVAAAPLGFVAGERVALWVGATSVLALWSMSRLAPLPRLPVSEWTSEPALALSLVAAAAGYRNGIAWTAIAVTFGALVVTAAIGLADGLLPRRHLPGADEAPTPRPGRDVPAGPAPVSWRQAPRDEVVAEARRPERSTRWLVALTPVVAAAGPTIHVAAAVDGVAALVAALAIGGASVALGAMPGREWLLRLAPILAAGMVVAAGADETTARWAILSLLLSEWGIRRRPPHPRLPTSPAALGPALAIAVVAAVAGRHDGPPDRAVLATLVGLGAVWASSAFEPRWRRLLAGIGRLAWHAVSFVLFALLGVVVLAVPWVAHRLFRLDPVARRAPPGWSPRGRPDPRPDQLWAVDGASAALGRWARLRWAIAVPATFVLAAVVVIEGQHRFGSPVEAFEPPPPAAIGDVDWWDGYIEELHWAFIGPAGSTNPQRFPPLRDVRGRYINVVDGERVSWVPPECDCPRVTLWAYGGSTMIGWGQRDEFTIPSELAKLAYEDGISLEVHNRGITGDLGWEAADRFAWDVAVQEPPDVAVLYGGSNDLLAASTANEDRSTGYDPRWPPWWGDDSLNARFDSNWFVERFLGRPPPGAGRVDTPVPPYLDAEELGRAVAADYAAGSAQALALGAQRGVATHVFWQPDRYTRPQVDYEPVTDPALDARSRAQRRAAVDALPDEIEDLSDMFDEGRYAIYYDDVHTGEHGASLVAAEIYEAIRAEILAAAETTDD